MTNIKRFANAGRVVLVLSAIGLLLGLSGTAFSSGSAVPGRGGVKAEDIAPDAVNAKKIRDFNIGPRKLSYTSARNASETIQAGTSEAVTASCAESERMLSGGFDVGADLNVQVIRSRPAGNKAWEVFAHNYSGSDANLTVYAYCLS